MNVKLRAAAERDRELIKNIFNLYQNDLSEYCEGFDFLDSKGYFNPEASREVLPYGNGVYPYIITEDDRIVGFVMYTTASRENDGFDYCIEELYLIRPARGRGIAHEAVSSIFKAHPGRWSLCVYTRNTPARKFWKSVIENTVHSKPLKNDMIQIVFDI